MQQWPAGIAYVCCPHDIDRATYIKDCFQNNRISIKMEDGSYHNRVIIPSSILNEIEFPKSPEELGSAVGYVTETQHQKPMIFACYPKGDILGQGREHSFQFYRKLDDKFIMIDGDVKEGVLSININGGQGVSKMNISLDNESDTSELEVEVAGSVSIKTTNQTVLENHEEFRSVVEDSVEEEEKKSVISQTKEKTTFSNKHIVLNGENIEAIHYKGYRILINETGIEIDALDKEVTIRAGDSEIVIDDEGVEIESKEIRLNGSFEALYNKIPGTPIANVSQIGISKKVRIG